MIRPILLALLGGIAVQASAAEVLSPAPEAVSVTIYRDPTRSEGGGIDLDSLTGFALVTETRTVSLPAGEATLRFEGVADGIVPTSALVAGLPGGVVEKNRDARTLTPSALIDASLGKSVTLVRTDPATGRAREVRTIVRSGPGGGVLFETAEGTEALRCSRLPERLVFDTVPEGLSAKPTLSVITRSDRPVTATVTLAYLARGFDWSANYVATIRPDGRTLDLLGWVTLANGNGTGFSEARTQVVAGRLNRETDDSDDPRPWEGQLFTQCWPWDSTSTYPSWGLTAFADERFRNDLVFGMVMAPSPASPAMGMAEPQKEFDGKVMQEELGDLKLYRVPMPTTVAARGQKQVVLLEQMGVPFDRIYRAELQAGEAVRSQPAAILLRVKNERKNNLGLPLPSGNIAVFEDAAARPMLAGEDDMRDAAIGELVEIEVGESPDVQVATAAIDADGKTYEVTITNARSTAVTIEVPLKHDDDQRIVDARPRFVMKNGWPTWTVTIPAGGTRTLRYSFRTIS